MVYVFDYLYMKGMKAFFLCMEVNTVYREIIVFGGRVGQATPLDGIHSLDVDSMKWRPLRTKGERPPAQTNHETCSRQDIMFVLCNFDSPPRSELYLLDYTGEVPYWSILKKEGRLPRGMYGGAMNLVGSKLIHFGGYRAAVSTNHLFVYDLYTGRWSEGFFSDSNLYGSGVDDAFDVQGPIVPAYGRHVGVYMNNKIRYFSGERVLLPDIIELELDFDS